MPIDPSIPLSVAPHRAPNMLQMLLAVEELKQRQRYGQDAEEDRAVRRDELKFRIDQLKAAEQAKLDEAAQKTEDGRQHAFVRAVGSLKARPPEERAARYPALIAQLRVADKLPSGPVPETWEQFGGDGALDEFVAQTMTSEQFGAAFGPQKPAPVQGLMNLGGGFVFDPETRQIVREPPPEAQAAGAGFTLNPGDVRYDASGKQIASVPGAPSASAGFTLNAGDVRYDAAGQVIASRPAAPSTDGTGGAKLSAVAIEKIAGIEQSLGVMASLEKLVKDDWLGPVAGRVSTARISTPGMSVPDDLARFSAETSTLKNAIVKAITGAAMSEPEAARIMKQIPDFTDKPNVWRQKLSATRDNLKILRDKTIEMSGGTSAPASSAPDTGGGWTVVNGVRVRRRP